MPLAPPAITRLGKNKKLKHAESHFLNTNAGHILFSTETRGRRDRDRQQNVSSADGVRQSPSRPPVDQISDFQSTILPIEYERRRLSIKIVSRELTQTPTGRIPQSLTLMDPLR